MGGGGALRGRHAQQFKRLVGVPNAVDVQRALRHFAHRVYGLALRMNGDERRVGEFGGYAMELQFTGTEGHAVDALPTGVGGMRFRLGVGSDQQMIEGHRGAQASST
nr:hypothetical protein [Deinococcus aquatilis]